MDANTELDYYKNFDFDNAKIIKHPSVALLQERHRLAEQAGQSLDEDVIKWLVTQDKDTKQHINDMIRHAMALTEKVRGIAVA